MRGPSRSAARCLAAEYDGRIHPDQQLHVFVGNSGASPVPTSEIVGACCLAVSPRDGCEQPGYRSASESAQRRFHCLAFSPAWDHSLSHALRTTAPPDRPVGVEIRPSSRPTSRLPNESVGRSRTDPESTTTLDQMRVARVEIGAEWASPDRLEQCAGPNTDGATLGG